MSKFNVAIVGRPNVGKSSLFNRLAGERKAIVHDIAGTTRDLVTSDIEFNGKLFNLTDTAGYFNKKNNFLHDKSIEKVHEAISSADLILIVVDGNVNPTDKDQKVIEIVRKTGKNAFLVINKIDNDAKNDFIPLYTRLGLKTSFTISVIHNRGISDLLDNITKLAPKGYKKPSAEKTTISIIGRPNVGKSSILNAIAQREKAIVSQIPGTTRDVVEEEITLKNKVYFFKDTAGARRPGKIGKAFKSGEPVEKYSSIRTLNEIDRSDIVLLILDSSDKLAAQDLHIAGLAKEKGKGLIIVVNKWDLNEGETQEAYLKNLTKIFNFMIWVPVIFVSAKTGQNIDKITEIIDTVSENQKRKIATSQLNRILEDFTLTNLPKGRGTYKPKVFFIAQTGTIPPEFTITAKFHLMIHFSWKRAFENELRRHFDFSGTPIRVILKGKR